MTDANGNPVTQAIVSVTDSSGNVVTGIIFKESLFSIVYYRSSPFRKGNYFHHLNHGCWGFFSIKTHQLTW